MDCRILTGNLKNVVKDSLEGLICVNQEITLFDFGNVVVRKDYFGNENVRIVSGGSNLFGELVGKGMLTASVQGDNVTAPPSKVILRTIRELSYNHLKGVLIIVPANSGDLLNFGLATERAINDNIRVKLLPINDDCNKSTPKICRIGLSGVILIYKIAGAMSEKGRSLSDIFAYCEKILQNISSDVIMLSNLREEIEQKCICKKKSDAGETSGEPNQKKPKVIDISYDICNVVIERITDINDTMANDKLNLKPGESIVVLLNNNGGLGKTEEFIFVKEFVKILQALGITVERFYVSNYFKCAQDIDLTVTILKLVEPDILELLDSPCSAPGWKIVNQGIGPLVLDNPLGGKLRRKDRLAPPIRGPKLDNRLANVLLLCTQFACDALISCEKQLNIIDSEKGDGDTGTRLRNVCEVLLKRIKDNKIVTNYPFTFCETLSRILEATVGGALGCIYSTIFEAAANCFGESSEDEEVSPSMWLKALEKASEALGRYGNVEYDDGTMYDPIFMCTKTVQDELLLGRHFIVAFGKGVSRAEEAAQATRKSKMKYPDAGAHAVGIWMRAVFEGVKLRCPIDE
ncbi:hypothetical protein NQ317_015709 [Molorchus minor]|uniref:Triokinase/FMN cyclase n=1 Tax=Molorchus minor TaxID=1323400 RepID=A0ABQ9JLA5_9CUCU|nr:hypothetical protein NQ317_015709 [Molorchus minor]